MINNNKKIIPSRTTILILIPFFLSQVLVCLSDGGGQVKDISQNFEVYLRHGGL